MNQSFFIDRLIRYWHSQSTPRRTALIFLLLGLGIAVLQLLVTLLGEWRWPVYYDGLIYRTVGQGILNGYVPYRDLFETKPPGIFLLAALSLKTVGSLRLVELLHIISLACIPLAAVALTYRCSTVKTHSPFVQIGACIISIAFTIYVAQRTLWVQEEVFGALFTLGALLCLAKKNPWHYIDIVIAGMCTALAIGFKEPFFLIILAGSLIVCDSPKIWFFRIIETLAAASFFGVLLLLALGYLDEYLLIYLPEMLASRIHILGPPWIRAFEFDRSIQDIFRFSPILGFIFCLSIAGYLKSFFTHQKDRLYLLARILLLAFPLILLYAVDYGYSLHRYKIIALLCIALMSCLLLYSAPHKRNQRIQTLITTLFCLLLLAVPYVAPAIELRFAGWWYTVIPATFFLAVPLILLDAYLFHRKAIQPVWLVTSFFLSLYLTGFAVGLGGQYFPDHFVLLAPFGIVLTVKVLSSHTLVPSSFRHYWSIASSIMLFLLAVSCSFTMISYQNILQIYKDTELAKTAASHIDHILDDCGYDQYLYLGDASTGPYAYTQHSPAGPLFLQYHYSFFASSASSFVPEFFDALHRSDLIVLRDVHVGPYRDTVEEYLSTNFSSEPWSCADDGRLPEPYSLLYRHQS